MYCSRYSTQYGCGSVYATAQGLVRVDIPDLRTRSAVRQAPTAEFASSALTVHAATLLQRYFQGEHIGFDDVPLDMKDLTPFRMNVLMTSRNLRYGEICSYGQLACACGSPLAARAIGGALASNPVPIVIPCHRVVGADGRLTGFSAPGGDRTKLELLKMEGVAFKGMQVVTNQLVMHSNMVK